MQPLAAWRVPTIDITSPDTGDRPLAWGIQFLPEFLTNIGNVEMVNLFLASLEGPAPTETRGWAQGCGLYVEELWQDWGVCRKFVLGLSSTQCVFESLAQGSQ